MNRDYAGLGVYDLFLVAAEKLQPGRSIAPVVPLPDELADIVLKPVEDDLAQAGDIEVVEGRRLLRYFSAGTLSLKPISFGVVGLNLARKRARVNSVAMFYRETERGPSLLHDHLPRGLDYELGAVYLHRGGSVHALYFDSRTLSAVFFSWNPNEIPTNPARVIEEVKGLDVPLNSLTLWQTAEMVAISASASQEVRHQ